MVDFIMSIADVHETDTGCYWCKIEVESTKCTFPLVPSSNFCLYEKEYYAQMDDCTAIPTNDTELCANSDRDSCEHELSISPLPTQSFLESSVLPNSFTILPTLSRPAHPFLSFSSSSSWLSWDPSFSLRSPSFTDNLPHSTSIGSMFTTPCYQSSRPSGTTRSDADSITGMGIGLYTGIALCLLLLVTVFVLVAVLVYMVKRKPGLQRGLQARTSTRLVNSW